MIQLNSPANLPSNKDENKRILLNQTFVTFEICIYIDYKIISETIITLVQHYNQTIMKMIWKENTVTVGRDSGLCQGIMSFEI